MCIVSKYVLCYIYGFHSRCVPKAWCVKPSTLRYFHNNTLPHTNFPPGRCRVRWMVQYNLKCRLGGDVRIIFHSLVVLFSRAACALIGSTGVVMGRCLWWKCHTLPTPVMMMPQCGNWYLCCITIFYSVGCVTAKIVVCIEAVVNRGRLNNGVVFLEFSLYGNSMVWRW